MQTATTIKQYDVGFSIEIEPPYTLLFTTHDYGTYSIITETIKLIVNEMANNKKPACINFQKCFSRYKTKKNKNSDYYPFLFNSNIQNIQDFKIPQNIKGDMFGNPLWATYVTYKKLNLEFYKNIIDTYFSPSTQVNEKYLKLINDYNIDFNKTIAVCYRGTDKYKECKTTNPEKFIELINKLIEQNPNHKILIQTDDKYAQELFVNTFKDKCFYIKENVTVKGNKGIYEIFNTKEYENCDLINFTQTFDATCRIIANCDVVVINSSNVSCYIAFCRGNSKNFYQFDANTNLISP